MTIERMQLEQFVKYLQPRAREAHKGNFGHVLIVGGDYGFSGAVRMAAEAALRVGAGLVSVATRSEHALTLNLTRPEIMCHGVSFTKALSLLCEKAAVIAVGPGMGCSSWGKKMLAVVLKSKKPLVVDADALNLLAKKPLKNDKWPSDKWVLTPHAGEAARLLQTTIEVIQQDRLLAIRKLQEKFGGICVLKGASSLVLGPGPDIALCEAGNPGMATAGMGDVLTGVIAGLVAQQIPLEMAAKLGVLLHAMAGDLAARDGERGMLALDLMPHLRRLVNLIGF